MSNYGFLDKEKMNCVRCTQRTRLQGDRMEQVMCDDY